MVFEIEDTLKTITFCEATRWMLFNKESIGYLSDEELAAFQANFKRDCRTKSPKRVVYKLNGGGWRSAYVDETLTQYFTNIILPLWERQKLK